MTATCADHGLSLPCTGCASDHLAGQHVLASHHTTCLRCGTPWPGTGAPQPDAQHLAAADDSLNSPNERNDR